MTDKVIEAAISQLNLKPFKSGEPAVPQGSRQKVVEPTPKPSAPEKRKKVSISLTTSQETRCIRESTLVNLSVRDYLQQIVDEALNTGIGKPVVTGATFQGPKVTAPTNTFGREV